MQGVAPNEKMAAAQKPQQPLELEIAKCIEGIAEGPVTSRNELEWPPGVGARDKRCSLPLLEFQSCFGK